MIVKCSGFTKIADRYRELFTVGKCYLVDQKSEKFSTTTENHNHSILKN